MDEFRPRRRLAQLTLAVTVCCSAGQLCAVERTTAAGTLANLLAQGLNDEAASQPNESAVQIVVAEEMQIVRALPKVHTVPDLDLSPAEPGNHRQASHAPRSLAELIKGERDRSVVQPADPVTPDLDLVPKVKRLQVEPIVVPKTPPERQQATAIFKLHATSPIRSFRMMPIQNDHYKSKPASAKPIQAIPASARPNRRSPAPARPVQAERIHRQPVDRLSAEPIPAQRIVREQVGSDEVIAVSAAKIDRSSDAKRIAMAIALPSPLDFADAGANELVPVDDVGATPALSERASLQPSFDAETQAKPKRALVIRALTTAAMAIDPHPLSERLRQMARSQGFEPLPLESIRHACR